LSDTDLEKLGYDERLYILAFDHRGSFEKMVGATSDDPAANLAKVRGAKQLVWEGFERAVEQGAPKAFAGVLVDDQYGPDVARAAKAGGFVLAMPVEKSGQNEFDFEHGDAFGEKIEEFDPDFSKVLVRYNPDGDAAMNERQTARLARLGDWLHSHDRKFLFELLVPAEPSQLESVGGSAERYDAELRPGLMMDAILALRAGGVEADIWKIEGIDDRDACDAIAHLVRNGGRDHVSCVVLGRGASDAKVDEWLRAGAGLEGYIGFAIGRSIFSDGVKAYAADPEGFDRDAAVESISANYLRFIEVYDNAQAAV
jgi:myo-inositol catabolism protein IolC